MLAFGEARAHMYCALVEFVLSLVAGFVHLASPLRLAPSTVDPFADGACRNPEELTARPVVGAKLSVAGNPVLGSGEP